MNPGLVATTAWTPFLANSATATSLSVDLRSVKQRRKRDDGRGPAAPHRAPPAGRISAPGPSDVPRGGDRQRVGSLVERVADVPLDPVPANLLVV